MREPLILGHGASRPLTPDEQNELARIRLRKIEMARKEEERKKRLEGYLFWCSEGCGFVEENHRCEQWSNITYVPPDLVEAIKALK